MIPTRRPIHLHIRPWLQEKATPKWYRAVSCENLTEWSERRRDIPRCGGRRGAPDCWMGITGGERGPRQAHKILRGGGIFLVGGGGVARGKEEAGGGRRGGVGGGG